MPISTKPCVESDIDHFLRLSSETNYSHSHTLMQGGLCKKIHFMNRVLSLLYFISEILKINNLIQDFNSCSELTHLEVVAKEEHCMITKPICLVSFCKYTATWYFFSSTSNLISNLFPCTISHCLNAVYKQ